MFSAVRDRSSGTTRRTVRQRNRHLVERLEDRTLFATAFALSGTNLLSFDTANPTATASVAITGVNAGETLVGIDFRPQNGFLYGLGVNATSNNATLYAISTQNGVVGNVGALGSIAFTTDGATPVDLPDPATTGYGFDFNPAADRIRVVAGALNFRVNPNNGAPIDGDNGGAVAPGTNPDGTNVTSVGAAAYTNNQPNNGNVTTLYTLAAGSDQLLIQNPPNSGSQTNAQTVMFNGGTLNLTSINGFDIPAGVNAASSNAPVVTGSGFASLNVGGTTSLYTINLVNAEATFVGNIGNGSTVVQGLAIASDLGGLPAISLSSDGLNLLRYNTATPGTVTTVPITAGITAGETLVGIDYRPTTGQLYAVGIFAANNTGTLYVVTPQNVNAGVDSATVSAVGTFPFVLASDGTTPVDLPDPATAGYGIDFNPTVDRLRVTTSTGLNFRLNPRAAGSVGVDGDGNGANGLNMDGDINGSGVTGVSGTAYTNSFNSGGNGASPVGITTQYTIDATTDSLYIQNPPNNGTQTTPIAITLSGSPLDFSNVSGFDIPSSVVVGSPNAAAAGLGYATLTVGGVSRLYAINLATGVATNLGTVGAGSTPLSGLALANALGELVIPPSTSISDVTAAEGNGPGSTSFNFTVTLSEASAEEIRINYVTNNGSATIVDTDYVGSSGTVTFLPGQTTQTIAIAVVGDTKFEAAETFSVTLTGPAAGSGDFTIGDNSATGIIENDDAVPTVSIADAQGEEGTLIEFTVLLSAPSGQTTTVRLATSNGTAVDGPGGDYGPINPFIDVLFLAGATSATVFVGTNEDAAVEPDETFNLNILSTINGSAPDSVAVGTILNDDQPLTLVVTNTLDSGPGSLRAAINASNALVNGSDTTITFNIPGAGPHVIVPQSFLPNIFDKVTIDGTTEPDFAAAGKPVVVIDGSSAGPNVNGLAVLGDAADGTVIRGLQIISFQGNGIAVGNADDVTIQGNYIGTDGVGNRGNVLTGVLISSGADGAIIGGSTPAMRNVISGNQSHGVHIMGEAGNRSDKNVIQGNYIGLNAAGTAAIGNGGNGVFLQSADDAKVGGATPGEGNVISGNVLGGIADSVGQRIVIQGNFIGTNAAGLAPDPSLGNRIDGISLANSTGGQIGGTTPGARNVITNNGAIGINVAAQNLVIEGNYVGPDVTGAAGPGNVLEGIRLAGQDNTVGGTIPAAGNVVAFSQTGQGVRVFSEFTNANRNTIRLNSIFSNARLGIDIGNVDVDTNDLMDPDVTDNNGQNFPIIASAVLDLGKIAIQGSLNSVPNLTYVIDFYANDALNAGGFGEGKTYVGSVAVATDAAGNSTFNQTFAIGGLAAGQFITGSATRTDTAPFGDTSEFSQGVQITGTVIPPPNPNPNPPAPNGFSINDVTLPEGNSGTKPFVFTVTRPASNSKATVQYKTVNQTAGEGDYNPTSGTLTFSAGQTSKTITVNVKGDTKIEGEESFRVDLFSATGGVPIIAKHALGKIGNDDGVVNPPNPPAPPSVKPKITIGDGFVLEGNSGTKILNVIVSLSSSSNQTVKVNYATKNSTAGEGDYGVKSGTLTFAAGETSKTIQITIKGDTKKEADETFKVELSNAVNASILDASGTMTIKNDD